MNEDFDGRVDDQLRRTGEQWRARHPVPAGRVDRSLFADRRERSLMPALASVVGVLALVIVAVLVVLSLPPSDRNVAVGSPSPSGPVSTSTAAPASPTPNASSAEPSASASVPLGVEGRGDFDCGGGERGCATFFGVDGEEWRLVFLEGPEVEVALPPGTQVLLEPGIHRFVAHLDGVSDVGSNDDPPQRWIVSWCEAEVSIQPNATNVAVDIQFTGQRPCEIDVRADEPQPSPTPIPTPTPNVPLISLPPEAIRTVAADGLQPYDGFAQFGPIVASVTESGIQLLDLEHQTTVEIYASRRNERILSLDMSEDSVVWAVGKYDENSERVPCDHGGSLAWRIVAHTIATGSQTTIATGQNVTVIGCGAWAPTVAVDDELVAYARESGDPSEWEIVVGTVASGDVVRTIDAGRVVADLDLDGTDVAFVTGVPEDPSNPYTELAQLRLMLSVAAQPQPMLIDRGFWSVSFAGGRMAWATNREGSPGQRWTATTEDLTPVLISADAYRVGSPLTSGGLVTYGTSTDAESVGQIWDERTNAIYEVAPGIWMERLFSNGGWLVWYGDRNENGNLIPLVQGLPQDEVAELDP